MGLAVGEELQIREGPCSICREVARRPGPRRRLEDRRILPPP